ncbi:MAG TPA: hypothetical protein VFQ44_30100 [Streptosporangiaceae bacterium]|nr:hypothetical protein [Streptosporangiaceae bacterium]
MLDRVPPSKPSWPSRRWHWPAVLPVAGLAALTVMPFLPTADTHAAYARRAPGAVLSLTSASAGQTAERLPGWKQRFLASLPARQRGRAVKVFTGRPGSSACITIAGAAEKGQAWVTGFANVNKLRGAALVGPAFAELVALTKEIICPKSVIEVSTEVPDFRGKREFPPMRATFLAFGFVPVSATIQISQVGVGVIKVTVVGGVAAVAPYVVRAKVRLNVKVLKVKVDGVALPPGPKCGTASPGTAVLSNVNPTGQPGPNFWDLPTGGPLAGPINLPHFSRCGVNGDNLDAILDASISGPGNFAKLIQGVPCLFTNPLSSACPPQVPKPRR